VFEYSRQKKEVGPCSPANQIVPHFTYLSRGAVIAAGVHMAQTEDAILLIHGIDDTLKDLDFEGCVSISVQ